MFISVSQYYVILLYYFGFTIKKATHTTSPTPGFPGGNFGRDGGLGGGGGGVVLLQAASGVAGRAGDDDPEIDTHYKYAIRLPSHHSPPPSPMKHPLTHSRPSSKQLPKQLLHHLGKYCMTRQFMCVDGNCIKKVQKAIISYNQIKKHWPLLLSLLMHSTKKTLWLQLICCCCI